MCALPDSGEGVCNGKTGVSAVSARFCLQLHTALTTTSPHQDVGDRDCGKWMSNLCILQR